MFVRRAFGQSPGVVIGWSDWLINISTQAFLAVVVAEFLQRLGVGRAMPQAVLAPSLIAVFLLLNWSNTRLCGSSQSIGSSLKGMGLVMLILVLLVAPLGQNAAQPRPSSGSDALQLGALGVIVALRAVQSTYDGWNNCVYFSEEMERPERCLPRSLFGGIAMVTILYVFVNAALLRVLTPEAIAGSNLPAADALSQVVGAWAGVLLTVFGIVSVGAILNLNVMFGPRIALAMARDRVLPGVLAKVSPGGSPRLALTVTAVAAMIFSASGTYEQLLAMTVALGALVNLSVSLSALRLRRTEPNLPRPWKAPWFPWPILLAAAINAALLSALIYEDPVNSLRGTGLAVAIGLLYATSGKLRVPKLKPV